MDGCIVQMMCRQMGAGAGRRPRRPEDWRTGEESWPNQMCGARFPARQESRLVQSDEVGGANRRGPQFGDIILMNINMPDRLTSSGIMQRPADLARWPGECQFASLGHARPARVYKIGERSRGGNSI